MEAIPGALIQYDRWCACWCLPLNPSKCEASVFSAYFHHANLQPNLLLFNSRLRFNPTSTFLGDHLRPHSFLFYTCTFAEDQVFPLSQGLTMYLCFLVGLSKESLFLLYKAFLWPLITYASSEWFPFLSVTNFTKLERLHRATSRAFTKRLVALSPAASRFSVSLFSPLRRPHFPYESH